MDLLALFYGSYHAAQQDHWSERGRATSVAIADALDRPRRSVLVVDMA
jgi:hypothetical protein